MKKKSETVKKYYQGKWGAFSRKLRIIMRDNPLLPVVVSPHLSTGEDMVDCSVAYVHDYETGAFKEKIILIHNPKEFSSETNIDTDINPPF